MFPGSGDETHRQASELIPPLADDPSDLALDVLLPKVYEELREIAAAVLSRRTSTNSTTTTSLVNDVYVKLANRGLRFSDRNHFLRLAARAMRYILIDRARRSTADKRGGGASESGPRDGIVAAVTCDELLAIEEALSRLGSFDVRKARIVELRFFGGLAVEEVSEALGLSPATVKREWTLARAWLAREIGLDSARIA
jgi:RNA polymerase sigma-70 factor (ECF subfamily)